MLADIHSVSPYIVDYVLRSLRPRLDMAQYIESTHGVNNYFNIFTINFHSIDIRSGRACANTTEDNPCQPLGCKYIPCSVVACVVLVWSVGIL